MSRTVPDDLELGALFTALSDPTRRAIVTRLARSEATVLELAEPFDVSLPAISRHLKVLEQAHLITRGRQGRLRPCRLVPEALTEVALWATLTREAWESRLDRLDDFLRRDAATTETTETTETGRT